MQSVTSTEFFMLSVVMLNFIRLSVMASYISHVKTDLWLKILLITLGATGAYTKKLFFKPSLITDRTKLARVIVAIL
jgi:hypothetical protein